MTFSRRLGTPAPRAPRKTTPHHPLGSVHMAALGILTLLFVVGGGYLYLVNRIAVQGYHMRTLEREIVQLKEKNSEFRIAEAELRSLYRIEASGAELGMEKLHDVQYIEERGPIALK